MAIGMMIGTASFAALQFELAIAGCINQQEKMKEI